MELLLQSLFSPGNLLTQFPELFVLESFLTELLGELVAVPSEITEILGLSAALATGSHRLG